MPDFSVDPESAVTLYEQLRTQIVERVKNGELIVGTKLPTVRQLATDLGVAPYTVARVYRVLENDGFLETRGRNGTVVSAQADTAESILQRAASEYSARARELGIGADDAERYIRSALRS
ncbi:MAG: GntR family transcriptional regulator [Salinibacterium sp.]|nr:MAG: GntR family transcriptional regulator [Salinibacterium sp.]